MNASGAIVKVLIVLGLAARTIIAAPAKAALGARMALWVMLISLAVRWTSLPRAQQLASLKLRSSFVDDSPETLAQLAGAIDRVLGVDLLMFRRSCWKRAMVLQRFLALHGVDSRVNFGLRKERDGTVSGHAWLEREGRPFLETAAGVYTVTFSLPATPSGSGSCRKTALPII